MYYFVNSLIIIPLAFRKFAIVLSHPQSNMDYKRIEQYILTHTDDEGEVLRALDRDAHVRLMRPRMISGHLQGRLLKMIVRMLKPHHIMEIGTYTGYAALCMAEGMETPDGSIHTIEVDDEMEDFIRKYLQLSPWGNKVTLHLGDAIEIIPQVMRQYKIDLVYMDANKREYIDYYNLVMQYLPVGGVILADNTLWDGKVVEDPLPTDAQTFSILAFNDLVQADKRVENLILPLRDGLSLIYKVSE